MPLAFNRSGSPTATRSRWKSVVAVAVFIPGGLLLIVAALLGALAIGLWAMAVVVVQAVRRWLRKEGRA